MIIPKSSIFIYFFKKIYFIGKNSYLAYGFFLIGMV